ncbi:MAG: TonB-dependent receptor [Marinilabiliales bacterium]|nr:TonB-dependent receptor [Marinilabiliales bacterium]
MAKPNFLLGYCLLTAMLWMTAISATALAKPTIRGKVVAPSGEPLAGVNVKLKEQAVGTFTDRNGFFQLEVPDGTHVILQFSRVGYRPEERNIHLPMIGELSLVLREASVDLPEVQVQEQRRGQLGSTPLDPNLSRQLPDNNGAVEHLIKTLPGVSSHSELSPQYTVRGGNYDENLLYVNGVEIFRPLSVKRGEQEGLSFLNPDLVSSIQFSPGGFESRFGDKMSSVLEVGYRSPDTCKGGAELGTMAATFHLEGRSPDKRLSFLTGIRYRDNRYLLGTLDQKGHYAPAFTDLQAVVDYRFSDRLSLNLMTNLSSNSYTFLPETRETSYGTMIHPYRLTVYYDGKEKDKYNNHFGTMTLRFTPKPTVQLRLTASAFYSDEQERYDILGEYYLNEVFQGTSSTTHPDSTQLLGVGSSLRHAANLLKASVLHLEHDGRILWKGQTLEWGLGIQQEKITDHVNEWEMRDSAGYSLPRKADQLDLYRSVRANNQLTSTRALAYLQDRFHFQTGTSRITVNGGIRAQYWDWNRQLLVSPRISALLDPAWQNPWLFRAAWGIYSQMPFYKELKTSEGSLIPDVRAQQSIHYTLGTDHPFHWDKRPFNISFDLWYKQLTHLIPYQLTNLNLQYYPELHSSGYARGIGMMLTGELMPGATSWASLTWMKTEERIEPPAGEVSMEVPAGYLPRPSDQRINFSFFFQDYLPGNPNFRLNLTLLFGSGVPFGPPGKNGWMESFRMPAYKRVDAGLSAKVTSGQNKGSTLAGRIRSHDSWITLEIFNLFDLNNTISYDWVSDFENRSHAIPNYLTGRRLNVRFSVSF